MFPHRAEPSDRAPAWLAPAALVIALAIAAAILWTNRAFYHDDAYITLRYARNLLEGHGMVWNPGERVQGYTSFLHVVVIAALGKSGIDLRLASRLVSAGALALLLGGLIHFLRAWRLGPAPGEGPTAGARFAPPGLHPFAWLTFVLVATSAPLLVWLLGGLDTVLFTALVSLGLLFALQVAMGEGDRGAVLASGVALSLACLARPEGWLFLGAGFLLLAHSPRRSGIVWYAAPAVIVLAPYLLWVHGYYGDLLPNTFYAKMGGFTAARLQRGFEYLWGFASTPPFLVPAFLVAFGLAARAGRSSFSSVVIAAVVSAYLLYVAYVGGDHMKAYRFVLPVIPLLMFGAGRLACHLVPRPGRGAIAAGLALVTIAAASQLAAQRLNPREEDPAARIGTIVGKYIAAAWPERSLVALNTAGSTPFFAPRQRYVDMLGLNDRVIAKRRVGPPRLSYQEMPGHLKGDGRYVLDREPDFIIIGPAEGRLARDPWFLSDLEISEDARLAERYVAFEVDLDTEGRVVTEDESAVRFTFYARREWVQGAATLGAAIEPRSGVVHARR